MLDSGYDVNDLGILPGEVGHASALEESSGAEHRGKQQIRRIRREYLAVQLGAPDRDGIMEATSVGDMASESFDTQCEALRLLLASPLDLQNRTHSILSTLDALCNTWWTGAVSYTQVGVRLAVY